MSYYKILEEEVWLCLGREVESLSTVKGGFLFIVCSIKEGL